MVRGKEELLSVDDVYAYNLNRAYNKMESSSNHSVVLMKKYKLLEKIGSGSFGSIYTCNCASTQASTSIRRSTSQPNWYMLAHAGEEGQGRRPAPIRNQTLSDFSGHQYSSAQTAGITRLYDFGSDPDHDRIFMVIELLGQSLEDLFQLWYLSPHPVARNSASPPPSTSACRSSLVSSRYTGKASCTATSRPTTS